MKGWLQRAEQTDPPAPGDTSEPKMGSEFERLWLGFMTARVTLGAVFVLLQTAIYLFSPSPNETPLLICLVYLMLALAVRLVGQPQQFSHRLDGHWLRTVGVDVLTFASLQLFQAGGINYTPLLALPVLMASVLGSMLLALGAAAGVTLLLFAYAAWLSLLTPIESNTYFLQAALTGAGCFAISLITSQLARRLASVERQAQHNQLAAEVQRQVNALVIESLSDAVLVADASGRLRSTNPAARLLLGGQSQAKDLASNLNAHAGWQALAQVITTCFALGQTQQADISIDHPGQGARNLRVRAQLTAPLEGSTQVLCVVFMQDQREIQARIRAEKLAGMGRMSAAVAHEIRNPLAAISQANALLAEELHEPNQLRLTNMVAQNALRLEKIVRDVLHLAHAGTPVPDDSAPMLPLTDTVRRVCRDWRNQNGLTDALEVRLPDVSTLVCFDPEHLRRVLFNLLDNARRYARAGNGSIQVSADVSLASAPDLLAKLCIWSHGEALEAGVEQHLFEPFFSSESRSSGLGLYICRELCASHGASIAYERSSRALEEQTMMGNAFVIVLKCCGSSLTPTTDHTKSIPHANP